MHCRSKGSMDTMPQPGEHHVEKVDPEVLFFTVSPPFLDSIERNKFCSSF